MWEVWKMQGAIFNLGHMQHRHFRHPWRSYSGNAWLPGKDCSCNPVAFPPSMEVICNLPGQGISFCRGAFSDKNSATHFPFFARRNQIKQTLYPRIVSNLSDFSKFPVY